MSFDLPQFGAIGSLPIEALATNSEGTSTALPGATKKTMRNLLQGYSNTLPEPAEQDITIANLQVGRLSHIPQFAQHCESLSRIDCIV